MVVASLIKGIGTVVVEDPKVGKGTLVKVQQTLLAEIHQG